MSDFVFEAWPKIARLNRTILVTEKIDGSNAAILVDEDGDIGAQSRTRLITPEQDNYGFARWVQENKDALVSTLGPGRHFGEWWGSGIQRRYGLTEKRFSLFNHSRWGEADLMAVPQLGVVPLLYAGVFDQQAINDTLRDLAENGSVAAEGFMDPEGIVVYVAAARTMFKVTIKGDEMSKGQAEAEARRLKAAESQ